MTNVTWMLSLLLFSIVLIIFLIARVKLHAFFALMIACFVVGLGSGMPPAKLISTLESGIGGTLGFLLAIIGLGGILGKVLEESGGAERLAKTLLDNLGAQRAHWVMTIVGFCAGIPVFFDVGFVLLIPLIYVVARETRMNMLYLGIPLAISLMTVHCILPPHPAAMAITVVLGADVGKVILYAIPVIIPTIIICGPLFVKMACERNITPAQEELLTHHQEGKDLGRELPGLGITLFTIALPLILIIGNTLAVGLEKGSTLRDVLQFVGNPLTALMIAAGFAYWSLGLRQGRTMSELLNMTTRGLPNLANVIFIIGAGGAFNAVLVQSGLGGIISDVVSEANLNIIVLAWFIAWTLHFAIGSATIAMMSAASIINPLLATHPDVHPEVVAIAIGAGAIGWAHVTDSAFWLVKEYLGVSVVEALKKFTGVTVLASVLGLIGTLLLNSVIS